jgi:HrpA-like RNA helicase
VQYNLYSGALGHEADIVQPRRISAIGLAERVAAERAENTGAIALPGDISYYQRGDCWVSSAFRVANLSQNQIGLLHNWNSVTEDAK